MTYEQTSNLLIEENQIETVELAKVPNIRVRASRKILPYELIIQLDACQR